MTLTHLVCRVLLRLAPASFRARYGAEILGDITRRPPSRGYHLAAIADLGRAVQHERRGHRTGLLADLSGDVKYALRGWKRSPGFSLTVVLTLAVGLGLAAAIFSFADGYLFRPLPFPGGDRAYRVRDPNAAIALMASDTAALLQGPVRSYGFAEWSTSELGSLKVGEKAVPVSAYEITEGFRQTLALPLRIGRDFTSDDHRAGAELVAWLSHRFWMKEFGGDPAVVGRTIPASDVTGPTDLRIVGVLGPEFSTFDLNNRPPDLVMPARGPRMTGPNRLSFPVVLLAEGEEVAVAEQRIGAALQSVAPAADGRTRVVQLRSLWESQTRGGRPTARVLLAGAALVLLLAALNLVHLLLGRGAARDTEFATRLALGASRWRVVRVFLTESVLLGAVGIGAGLALGKLLSAVIEARVPQLPSAGRSLALVPMLYDTRVIVAVASIGALLIVVGGLWPAWRTLRRSLVPTRVSPRLSRTLLASELAVAAVVLVGASYIGMGIYRFLHQPLGFEYADRYLVVVSEPNGRPVSGDNAANVVRALRSIDAVESAGLNTRMGGRDVEVPGGGIDTRDVQVLRASAGWFETWGITIRAGRTFLPAEFVEHAEVAIVNEPFARLAWPGANPVGQVIRAGGGIQRVVVGVVRPPRWSLSREPDPNVYLPGEEQKGRASGVAWIPGFAQTEAVDDVSRMLTEAVRAVVPGVNVDVRPQTFDDLFMRDVGEARFQTPVVVAFSVLAVFLAGIGVFGLVSYLVERRSREFGIRMAIGATRRHIWHSVVREAVYPASIGLAIGSLAALALESVVESSVFGWESSGPWAIAVVTVTLLAVAVAAALVPASRATRIDPALTLRTD